MPLKYTISLMEQFIFFFLERQKISTKIVQKCPEKISTNSVYPSFKIAFIKSVGKQYPTKAEGERKVSNRGGAGERQGTLLTPPLCTVIFVCVAMFFLFHFWTKIENLRPISSPNFSVKNSDCYYWHIGLTTFVYRSNRTLKKKHI